MIKENYMKYAEIIVFKSSLINTKPFTYAIPEEFSGSLKVGNLVSISFGNNVCYGVCLDKHNNEPDYKNIKPIIAIDQSAYCLSQWQINLALFISKYYKTPLQYSFKLFFPQFMLKTLEAKPLKEEKHILEKIPLNPTQTKVVNEILENKDKQFLLYGITGSGKTEVYYEVIENIIKSEKQVLLMVPEISLTPQLIERTKKRFGDIVGVIHSKVAENKKKYIYSEINKGKYKIIIGPRSALFSPFKDLGLIILDEEHDKSYKQDSNPRYNIRTLANEIHTQLKIPVIYGSATPLIETFYKAHMKDIRFLHLPNRACSDNMPRIKVCNLSDERKKRNYSIFSDDLLNSIEEKISQGKQVILFLNRRGSYSSISCYDCGFVYECKSCEMPMTYYKYPKAHLKCLYCFKISQVSEKCPSCKSTKIKESGLGTEQVEDEIKKIFPHASTLRVDSDTTNTITKLNACYKKIRNNEAQIIVGTQMISKGLDIPNVSLVALILADIGLNLPDFRAHENIFQLITQVSGRSGRHDDNGDVIIQTYDPQHTVIQNAIHNDYKSFYIGEINLRKKLSLPPFSNIIKLTLKDRKKDKLDLEVKKMLGKINLSIKKSKLDKQIIALSYSPVINKIQDFYIHNILIKGNDSVYSFLDSVEIPYPWIIDVDSLNII